MATDREIIKMTQRGVYRTAALAAGIVDPTGEVNRMHSRVYTYGRTGTENAATNVAEQAMFTILRKSLVKSISFCSATAAANSNTDHNVVYVYKYNSTGGTKTLLGSYNTATAAQGATVAFQKAALSLVGGSVEVVAADSVISFLVGKFNAGQALANLSIEVDAEEI